MTRIGFAVVVLALSVGALSWADSKEGQGMDGTWLPSVAELGGQAFPDQVLKTMKLVVKGDAYTVTVGEATDKGTVKLDAAAKPKAIDIVGTDGPNKGKTILAIYKRDGDTLKVCYDLSGKKRPTEFKTTKGTQLFLVTYKREASDALRNARRPPGVSGRRSARS